MSANIIRCTTNLPVELRAALGVMFRCAAVDHGQIQGVVIGLPDLVDAALAIAPINKADDTLIALGASPETVCAAVTGAKPARVLVLVRGVLARPLRPLRGECIALPAPLGQREWTDLGYEQRWERSIQGVGTLTWAVAERILRRFRRLDLADRCRIAMLATLLVDPLLQGLGTTVVQEYRRIR